MTILVQDEDKKLVQQKARAIKKQLGRHGFGGRIERANSMEALMGSWPGHGYQNVRREPIHTLNLADLLPLTSQWAGQPWNTNPLFPPNSPALMLTTTEGGAPFWYSPYLHMVGNVKVLGPIRAGKSFFLALEMAQFRRYQGARIRAFDRGYSATPICLACGGHVHDIGRDATAFAPLAHVDDPIEREWALGYVEILIRLQGAHVSPEQRGLLWRALTLMGDRNHSRTMSGLMADVQDLALRNALRHYTEGGGAGRLLDADADTVEENDFQVFELEELMSRGKVDLIPVLLYLFHTIDRECQDGRPTRIYSDENWRALLEPEFAAQFNSWLRDKPKQNAAVVLATQSLAEIAESAYYTIIEESCQTSLFLPNPAAKNENSARLYRKFGLTERKIERLAELIPRQEYLYTSPLGAAVFQLQAGPLAHMYCGVTDRGDIAHIMELARTHGKEWTHLYEQEFATRRRIHVDVRHDGPGATVPGGRGYPGH
jgi:type IV secretion system protein VirB4